MEIILKILFYALSGFNGLIAIVFFFGSVAAMVSPPITETQASDKYVVAIGCAAMLGILVWAFQLAILQGRLGAGLGAVALSYLAWILIQLTIIAIISIKGNWHWQ